MTALKFSAVALFVACGSSQPPAKQSTYEHKEHHVAEDHHAHQHAGPVGHRFEKADDWVPMFDDPKRDAWQKPDAVVAALALSPGMLVADIGAGTGYFEARLSKAVGANGKVIAIDVEPDMVRYLGERAKRENTPNVEARLTKADETGVATSAVDRILIVDTWHHIGDRPAYAKKLATGLKPGGFVLIVDFTLEANHGPPKEHRLAPDVVKKDLADAGLTVSAVDAGLPDQYVIKGERAK